MGQKESRQMAGYLNKVMIIGNVGADPEMRYTPSGKAVTSFRVAVNRQWTGQDGPQKETEWFGIVTWDKLAEACSQYVKKGSSLYVEGRLQTRSWDGQDGQKHYRTEVVAQAVQFLDPKGSGSGVGAAQRAAPGAPGDDDLGGDTEPDDLPF
jgi:single-strand DNA-binding protein